MLSRLARRGRYGIATTVPPAPTATQLAMVTTPAGARDSTVFSTQPAVRLKDAGGNNVAQSGVSVTVGINTGSGTLGPPSTTAVTDGSGIATFAGLFIAGSGSHSLAFGSAGLTGVNSDAFTVNAATKLALITDVGGAVVDDVAFPQQPVLELQDANSLAVTKSGVSVTASKATGTGTLAGTTAVNTASTGRATYTNLKIQGTGNHSLSWASSGLTGVTGGTFSVQAAGGAAPVLVEDFSTYSSTANMKSDPRGIGDPLGGFIYDPGTAGANNERIQLDTGVGLNAFGYSLTKSLKYIFRVTGLVDEDTASMNIAIPGVSLAGFGEASGQTVKELWWEMYVKFPSNFSDARPGGATPTDWKTVLTGFNRDGYGRADHHLFSDGPGGNMYSNVQYAQPKIYEQAANLIWDNQWHQIRQYYKLSATNDGTSGGTVWVDGVQKGSRFDITLVLSQGYTATPYPGFRTFGFGKNWSTPATEQHMHLGRVALWTSNPGW